MMRDLGPGAPADDALMRLFTYQTSNSHRPVENFTTEALGIAIRADDRPFVRALQRVGWPDGTAPRWIAEGEVCSVDTQVGVIDGAGVRKGQVDLVVTFGRPDRPAGTIWAECKIDAGVHGDQLATYAGLAALADYTHLITVSPDAHTYRGPEGDVSVPWLPWRTIADAVRETADADRWWTALVSFLHDHSMVVASAVSTARADDAQILDAVNAILGRLWPDHRWVLVWARGKEDDLHGGARKEADRGRGYRTTAGPLRYGMLGAQPFVTVADTGHPFGKRPTIPAAELVALADARSLPAAWVRTVSSREAALAAYGPDDPEAPLGAVVGWFEDRIAELKAARVLDEFLAKAVTHRG